MPGIRKAESRRWARASSRTRLASGEASASDSRPAALPCRHSSAARETSARWRDDGSSAAPAPERGRSSRSSQQGAMADQSRRRSREAKTRSREGQRQGRLRRRRQGYPTILVNGAVAEDFEVLRGVARGRLGGGPGNGVPQRRDALALRGHGPHHLRPGHRFQPRRVDDNAVARGFIGHVERNHYRHAGGHHFNRQEQRPAQGRRIDHYDHGLRRRQAAAEQGVDGDLFLARARAETVGPGQVDQFDRASAAAGQRRRDAIDRDAGIVGDVGARAGEGVEDCGFARVGVARNQDDGRRRHSMSMPSASARRIERAKLRTLSWSRAAESPRFGSVSPVRSSPWPVRK